ncbi:hypothetical protein Bca4012_065464 [Brassica carinata]
MYDGTGDPDNHIAQYKQRMLAVALPKESREATMCKWFGSTLIGPALQWYINLPSRSISSFAVLSEKFVEQFASNQDLEKTSDNLYEILQHRLEPLRTYIARFNQEKVAVPEFSKSIVSNHNSKSSLSPIVVCYPSPSQSAPRHIGASPRPSFFLLLCRHRWAPDPANRKTLKFTEVPEVTEVPSFSKDAEVYLFCVLCAD